MIYKYMRRLINQRRNRKIEGQKGVEERGRENEKCFFLTKSLFEYAEMFLKL